MAAGFPVTFSSIWFFLVALAMAFIAVFISLGRRPAIPRLSAWLALAGMLCLATAAGQPIWHRPYQKTIGVMVDLSPSTRGAQFRNPAAMSKRLHELIGDTPYRLFGFSDTNQPIKPGGPWAEMPADETVFSPIVADAIVLFSDARFYIPAGGPPTFVVADPALDHPQDARVDRLEIHGTTLSATIENSSQPRIATFDPATRPTTAPVENGRMLLTQTLPPDAQEASVQLNSGDLWPENDFLPIHVACPIFTQRWWVGGQPPDATWHTFAPSELPADFERYFAPSVIVLNNVDAPSLGPVILDRISRYIRALSGSLLIVGGDHAFTSGDYAATPLEVLSPLAMTPPRATTRWILLADGSGSMAETTGIATRFQRAAAAIVRLLPHLPYADSVNIGQFSDTIQWWSTDTSPRRAMLQELPPRDAEPNGPTDFETVLNRIADDVDSGLPTQLVLLSDCDTHVENPQQLANVLKSKKIVLRVLALSHGSGIQAIRQIAAATGGALEEQFNPDQWTASAQKLFSPSHFLHTPATVQFLDQAKQLGSATTSAWHQMWERRNATLWATSTAPNADTSNPMAAFWTIGGGRVAATAFAPPLHQIDALARLIAQPPRDPRFTVRWQAGQSVRLTIDAVDQGDFLNDLHFWLALPEDDTWKQDIPQTAPGRYETVVPSTRKPRTLTLCDKDGIVDAFVMAGRYPPEYEAIGNDTDAMQRLADSTGGAVIKPSDHAPIDFHWPQRDVELTPLLCTAGATLLAAAAIRWRML